MRDALLFVAKVTVAHVISYLVVGALAYEWLTKPFYEGSGALFTSFMRSPADPEDLSHITLWLLPAQLARGTLFGAALLPLRAFLLGRPRPDRFLALAGLCVVSASGPRRPRRPATSRASSTCDPSSTGLSTCVSSPSSWSSSSRSLRGSPGGWAHPHGAARPDADRAAGSTPWNTKAS